MFECDQISLFDTAPGGAQIGDLARSVRRTELGTGAWVDHAPSWVSGSDDVFARLLHTVDWQHERRPMYDRVVDVPRLMRFYGEDEAMPDPLLADVHAELDRHYRTELGEGFATVGMCCYRDGADSVAWHGDTIGRGSTQDTMVAIVSFGQSRPLLLRSRAGGDSLRFELGHGDLLVMGGSCQRTWEHCVPKTTRRMGPRISVQYRPRGVR
ncbi:alpha-ketoglutarate-dependent dioxygenase AlkB [Aldersonia kunmingensis]|uniref:alpha-ketoglutarate-dependent dioxygenase AlkB n=1 Tax=Aldersonia kunmingensis TaxID=408066 RepID=UPI0008325325|nr:alpha-ketoglutarate-dependent dioxygenase AlkB [Aldersonia kunmingensis]